jgi:hypothetical protein
MSKSPQSVLLLLPLLLGSSYWVQHEPFCRVLCIQAFCCCCLCCWGHPIGCNMSHSAGSSASPYRLVLNAKGLLLVRQMVRCQRPGLHVLLEVLLLDIKEVQVVLSGRDCPLLVRARVARPPPRAICLPISSKCPVSCRRYWISRASAILCHRKCERSGEPKVWDRGNVKARHHCLELGDLLVLELCLCFSDWVVVLVVTSKPSDKVLEDTV